MAHDISFNQATGKHELFSRGPAWHQLGQIVGEARTWEQAMTLAGLDWEVEKVQLPHPKTGEPINVWGTFRSDNDAFLGHVGKVYTPIQNRFQFDFVDAILESENGAHYESAGALGNGGRVFCLAKIGCGFDIHGIGDRHESYMLFTTAHDGTASAKGFFTSVRVVCQNTLQMALTRDGKSGITIRHTKNHADRLLQARALIGAEKRTETELREKLEVLATRRIRPFEIEKVIARVFPKNVRTAMPTGQAQTTIAAILERFESNDGDTFKEIRGTAYNLLNAVTEYTDHHKPVRYTEKRQAMTDAELRADNAVFGSGADFKRLALDAILEATKYGKTRAVRRPLVAVTGGAAVNVVEMEIENNPVAASLLESVINAPQSKKLLDSILETKLAA